MPRGKKKVEKVEKKVSAPKIDSNTIPGYSKENNIGFKFGDKGATQKFGDKANKPKFGQ